VVVQKSHAIPSQSSKSALLIVQLLIIQSSRNEAIEASKVVVSLRANEVARMANFSSSIALAVFLATARFMRRVISHQLCAAGTDLLEHHSYTLIIVCSI
jgi:hypothetical protein